MSDFTTTNITLDTTRLDEIMGKLDLTLDRILVRFAFGIEAEAKMNAPVDTSALRNSIYTVTTQGEDGYNAAAAAAEGARPGVKTEALPVPSAPTVAHVGPCVEYAGFVELGTSRMAAEPYLVPAVEHQAGKLNDGSMFAEMFT